MTVSQLLRPRSIAIIGASSRPGSASQNILNNLLINDYAGEIHLVGRGREPVNGYPIVPSVDELPKGIDLAILALPSAAAEEALDACVKHGIGAGILFASGFAESGDSAREEQGRLGETARAGGLTLLGPNCLGLFNYRERLCFCLIPRPALEARISAPSVTVLGQSGGMLTNLQMGLEARGIPVGMLVSTGNEADVSVSSLISAFIEDEGTSVIAVYAEQILDAPSFLRHVGAAKRVGKRIVLLHPGRTSRAKKAMQSHTGALAADYDVMRLVLERAGAIFVETFEEFTDCVELLHRYPDLPRKGVAISSGSGAFGAMSLDYCESIGLDVPELSADTLAALNKLLPSFVSASNPLDLSTQPAFQPDLYQTTTAEILADPNVDSLVIHMAAYSETSPTTIGHVAEGIKSSSKMVLINAWGDTSALHPGFVACARENGVVLTRSAERAFRALACLTRHGQREQQGTQTVRPQIRNLPDLPVGVVPEWLSKQVLASIGISIPNGVLAENPDEAAAAARRVGYPVALKAQAAALPHKTEAGGVALNIGDEEQLRKAIDDMKLSVATRAPSVKLDGYLIEAMASHGLELMVGARRDPNWGIVVVVAFGGVNVEAVKDIRLLPPDLDGPAIIEELKKLRGARLFDGFRGSPPVELDRVADVITKIQTIMQELPDISEIEINPLLIGALDGKIIAADALLVTGER